ncbi:MAG: SPOR domain-containing protein [Agarilytica sp.]
MRWIFFTLAAVNVLTLMWALIARPQSEVQALPQSQKSPYTQFPQISLLSEIGNPSGLVTEAYGQEGGVDEQDEVQVDLQAQTEAPENSSDQPSVTEIESEPVSTAEPIIPMHDNKMLCDIVGPFESNEVAIDLIERLKAVDVSGEVKELVLPAGAGYWVYLDPLPNRREALRKLKELQVKRIDSYVIPKGDLANGISLGMFSKKSLSDAKVKSMTAIGLEPRVEEIERTYRELWVMLKPGEPSKMSQLTWDRVMEGIKDLQRRQNYCLDVASE